MDEWSDWVIAFALILCFLARLSWGLMYAGFILVVATLMSLIVKSAQVVVLTGFMVVFLLFLLYGLSLVSWWVLPAPLPSLQSCVTNCVSAFSVLCSICTRHYPCSIQLKMMRHTFQILYRSAFSPYSTHPRESANKKKMVWVFSPHSFGDLSPGLVDPVALACIWAAYHVSSSWPGCQKEEEAGLSQSPLRMNIQWQENFPHAPLLKHSTTPQ